MIVGLAVKSFRNGLGGLNRFSGRDNRLMFWPYGGVVIGLWLVAMSTPMLGLLPARTAAPEGRDAVLWAARSMAGDIALAAVVGLLCGSLVAASVTRRLHDRNHSGLWAAPAAVFLVLSFAIAPWARAAIPAGSMPEGPWFAAAFIVVGLYIGSLMVLLATLAGRGDKGANRFGEPPVRARD